ncbi:hypothetical protein BCD49_34160 [Pseudofrankia sp. EUN1h]|nr:hypothetical protein BCD49_34160 [Pseudofrankia sp. EUN1h]
MPGFQALSRIQILAPAAESAIKPISGFSGFSACFGEIATRGVTRQVRRSSGRLGGGGGSATSRIRRIGGLPDSRSGGNLAADPAGTPSPVRKGARAR